jgi:hypothetical protein
MQRRLQPNSTSKPPMSTFQPSGGKLYTVTGTALRPPRSQLTVELVSDMGPVGGSVDESGRFTFEQLAPGTYELQGEASDFRGQKFGGYRKIMVDQNLDATLEMPLQRQLYCDFEDQHGTKIDGRQSTVWARRKGLAGEGPRRRVRSLDPLPPGLWEISVTPPAEMIVASIAPLERGDYSSLPAAEGWEELFLPSGRATSVKVVLSTAQATLHGKVIDSGKVAAGAPVFLEPLDLEWGTGLLTMRTARTDSQGRYGFTGLPPGNYRVASSFDFSEPNLKDVDTARAVTIAVKEGTETSQNLELFVVR